MRVGVHLENAITQPSGGLVALLTGTSRESFASLLDGNETLQPGLDKPVRMQGKQGGGDDRKPQQRKHEQPRGAKSSEGRAVSVVIGQPAVDSQVIQLRSDLRSEAPSPDSMADAQSDGVVMDKRETDPGEWAELPMMQIASVDDLGVAASGAPKHQEQSAHSGSLLPAERAMRSMSSPAETKIAESISLRVPGELNSLDGTFTAAEGNGLTTGVPQADSEAGLVQSRAAGRITADLLLEGMRQSGAAKPAQLLTQLGSAEAESGDQKKQVPAEPHGVDSNQSETGPLNQSEVHGAQTHHDSGGQTTEPARAAAASQRTVAAAGFDLVRAGQGDAGQPKSRPTDAMSSKSTIGMQSSSREAATQCATDASTTRMLANAMRGELHVGLHTEAFGRVTIQTNTGPGQFSAQVSLEDSKQSAALAAHLPAVEQRILQQHGVDASVRIVSESHCAPGGGGAAANGQRQSSANEGTRGERRNSGVFARGLVPSHAVLGSDMTRERQARSVAWGRLDVTV